MTDKMYRKLEKCWLSVLFAICICFGVFRVFQAEPNNLEGPSPTEGQKSTMSLEYWENRNRVLSDHVLFFNRIPKTGSEMFVLLLQWLQGANGFRHVRLGGSNTRRLGLGEQEGLVEEVIRIVRKEAVPVSFDRHVYFTNFSAFDQQSPIFLNLVRNPIDKVVSR